MADKETDTTGLDACFAAARRETATLPDALQARMLADAARMQSDRAGFAPGRTAAPGLIQQFLAMLGGWPAVGGLAAACAAGVWLGFAPPSVLPDPFDVMVQTDAELDILGAYDLVSALSEEG